MTTWDPGDELGTPLSVLRVQDAPRERVERIRGRCLAMLVARRHPLARRGPLPGLREWVEPAFALGLGALYLAEAVTRALAVYAGR